MSSIAIQLETLAGIKSDIKAAIIDKGQTVGDDFSTYATAIGNIEGGGGGGGTVIKQGAVSAGAVSGYWDPGNYESDLETQTLIDSLFSKIDISDLHTDFNANLSSVSQAVATAIGFSYNSTNNIIYYDFENTNDNKNGFKFVENSGTISLCIFVDNVATSSFITFEDSYKYLVYNTDSNGSVCLLFGDKDGVPQFGSMPYFLYASPCSYMYNSSHEASHEEGFVYPYESIGYIPYMSFSPLNYNIWSSGGYPGYPDYGFEDYGIYLIPYGWSNIDTNPIHCYFNNIYLISKFGYMSGNNYIINIEGTYYLIFSADEGNGGGVAFRLAKSESGGGGSATLVTKTATTNGTYRAVNDDADGYSEFTVEVPAPNLIDIEVTQNGYKYPSDYNPQPDGFRSVYVHCEAAKPEVTLHVRTDKTHTSEYTPAPGYYTSLNFIPQFEGNTLPAGWFMGVPKSQVPLDGDYVIGEIVVY